MKNRTVDAILICVIMVIFVKFLPDQLIDGVGKEETGWKSDKMYYVFPAFWSAVILHRILKAVYYGSQFVEVPAYVFNDKGQFSNTRFDYEYNGKAYETYTTDLIKEEVDWQVLLHVNPKDPQKVVFDLRRNTKHSLMFNSTFLWFVLAVIYYGKMNV